VQITACAKKEKTGEMYFISKHNSLGLILFYLCPDLFNAFV